MSCTLAQIQTLMTATFYPNNGTTPSPPPPPPPPPPPCLDTTVTRAVSFSITNGSGSVQGVFNDVLHTSAPAIPAGYDFEMYDNTFTSLPGGTVLNATLIAGTVTKTCLLPLEVGETYTITNTPGDLSTAAYAEITTSNGRLYVVYLPSDAGGVFSLSRIDTNCGAALSTVYFGEDAQAGLTQSVDPTKDPYLQRQVFLGLVSNQNTLDFEGISDTGGWSLGVYGPYTMAGAGSPTLTLDAELLRITTTAVVTSVGRWNTTVSGTTLADFRGALKLTPSTPRKAFGFYGIDWGDFSGQIYAEVAFTGGKIVHYKVAHSVSGNDGALLFWGIIGVDTIDYIQFNTQPFVAGLQDFMGIDDIVIGD